MNTKNDAEVASPITCALAIKAVLADGLFLVLATLFLMGCFFGGRGETFNGNATGGAGADVKVYKTPNGEYAQVTPHVGSEDVPVASECLTFWGSCPIPPGPRGFSCYCRNYFGQVAVGVSQ